MLAQRLLVSIMTAAPDREWVKPSAIWAKSLLR
jgi:hypothetical protein